MPATRRTPTTTPPATARPASRSVWRTALTRMAKVDRDTWSQLGVVSRWLVATRAAVFLMTLLSVGVGGVLAARDGRFDAVRLLVCAVGLVFAHATNNLVNDATDSYTGVDKDNYFRTHYGVQPLEAGLMTRADMALWIVANGGVALACGAYLVWANAAAQWCFAAGVFFVLCYTWPLKHVGLGEPAVLLVWGPLMVGGTYSVLSRGHWSNDVALISVAYALGPTTVLMGKHTDKLREDAHKGIRTLPVLLGERNARLATIAMLVAQPLYTSALVASGKLRATALVTWLALPAIVSAVRVFARPRPTEKPNAFPSFAWPTYLAAHAFACNRVTGALFLCALVAELL